MCTYIHSIAVVAVFTATKYRVGIRIANVVKWKYESAGKFSYIYEIHIYFINLQSNFARNMEKILNILYINLI